MIRFLLGVLLGVIIGASIATRLPNIEFDYFERKADQIIEDKIQQQTEDIKKQIKNNLLPSVYKLVKIQLSTLSEDTVLRGTFLDAFSQSYLGSKRHEKT